jgi:hypothetical protein
LFRDVYYRNGTYLVWGIMLCVVLEMAADELDRLHELIAVRFARAEPRARARRYVKGKGRGR